MEGPGCDPHVHLQPAGPRLDHPAGEDRPRREGDRQHAGGGGGRLLLLSAQPLPVRGGQVGDAISNMSKVLKKLRKEVLVRF